MISLPNLDTDTDIVLDTELDAEYGGDITVTLTYVEHDVLNDIINSALDAIQLIAPYGSGLTHLPLDNEIIQRISTIDNLKERFNALWAGRFL
jgi:hypothetical protein